MLLMNLISSINAGNIILMKKFFTKYLLEISLIVCIAVFFSGCENNMNKIPAYRKKQNGVSEGKKIESYYSQGAKVKAKLTAPVMLRYEMDSSYTEFPKSLHVDFYNDTMKIESKVDALYGKYFSYQNKVFLRDSVVVKNILKGDTLHCDELWWDQNTGRFYTDKPVRINTKDKILFGKGLEAAQNFSWYILKQPTGVLLAPENGLPK
jgi:LPS export ABC transporter protein LptC